MLGTTADTLHTGGVPNDASATSRSQILGRAAALATIGLVLAQPASARVADSYPANPSQRPLILAPGDFQLTGGLSIGYTPDPAWRPVVPNGSFGFAQSPVENVQLELPLLAAVRVLRGQSVEIEVGGGIWSIGFRSEPSASLLLWSPAIRASGLVRLGSRTSVVVTAVATVSLSASEARGVDLDEVIETLLFAATVRLDLAQSWSVEVTGAAAARFDVWPRTPPDRVHDFVAPPPELAWTSSVQALALFHHGVALDVFAGPLILWSPGQTSGSFTYRAGSASAIVFALGELHVGLASGVRWRF